MIEGVQILELARDAQRLFAQQEPRQKRRLLDFLASSCFWADGELRATFRQPFDLLAETTVVAVCQGARSTACPAKSENWLGREDSNLRWRNQNPLPYPLATPHQGTRDRSRAAGGKARSRGSEPTGPAPPAGASHLTNRSLCRGYIDIEAEAGRS